MSPLSERKGSLVCFLFTARSVFLSVSFSLVNSTSVMREALFKYPVFSGSPVLFKGERLKILILSTVCFGDGGSYTLFFGGGDHSPFCIIRFFLVG